MKRFALIATTAALLSLSLACGGGGLDVEGTWCEQDSRPECWQFEADGTVLQTATGGEDQRSTYTVEGSTIVIPWPKRTNVWEVSAKTESTMQMSRVGSDKSLLLIKSPRIER